jgi:hypothetical protein
MQNSHSPLLSVLALVLRKDYSSGAYGGADPLSSLFRLSHTQVASTLSRTAWLRFGSK